MIVGAGLVLAVPAVLWRIGVASQQPRWLPNVEQPSVPYEEVEFRSQGSRLKGWLMVPADGREHEKYPTVIVVHGWGSNRSRVLRYVEPLYQSGYAVMVYDGRSHGDSEAIKAPSAIMFRDDVEAAVQYAKGNPVLDPDKIAILGHSLGGYGAVLAMGRGLDVRAIVTDSMPIRFETMLRAELARRKLPLFPLSTIIPFIWLWRAKISRAEFRKANIPAILKENNQGCKLPVLMIHSRRDGFILPDDLLRMVRDIPVEHQLVEVDGHSVSEQDPAFWPSVLPFLTCHLAEGNERRVRSAIQ